MAGTMSNAKRNSFKVELLVVFAILISLGFPGNYALVYGERFEMIMVYAIFIAEILAMLLSSGESWLDIQIINLDKKYAVMFIFAGVIFAESMLVTEYKNLEFISCTRLVVTLFFVIWLQEKFEFKRMVELIGIAQEISRGRTTGVYEVFIFNDRNTLLSRATFTMFFLDSDRIKAKKTQDHAQK